MRVAAPRDRGRGSLDDTPRRGKSDRALQTRPGARATRAGRQGVLSGATTRSLSVSAQRQSSAKSRPTSVGERVRQAPASDLDLVGLHFASTASALHCRAAPRARRTHQDSEATDRSRRKISVRPNGRRDRPGVPGTRGRLRLRRGTIAGVVDGRNRRASPSPPRTSGLAIFSLDLVGGDPVAPEQADPRVAVVGHDDTSFSMFRSSRSRSSRARRRRRCRRNRARSAREPPQKPFRGWRDA